MPAIMPTAQGETIFVRCSKCETFYVPDEGPIYDPKPNTMTWAVYWRAPRARRTPTVCKHDQGMQWWNGTDWLPLEVRVPDQAAPPAEEGVPHETE